jgi:hypothetical protein
MWPFYISQENRLNSATPSTLFFSFPFYGRDQTPRTDTTTYLWPFFHRIRDKQNGDVTYAGYLFPYRFGPDQKDFWPFFGWKRTREVLTALPILERRADADDPLRGEYRTFRQFALWPIQRYQHEVSSFSESHRFWFLPFFWRFHRLERFPEREVSEWKVWPLLRYRRDGPTASFYFPSPLWFRQESLFERQWARLWRLYLYESNETRSGWEVLWGLFSHRHEKTVGSHTWSILYGLFEWETAEDGTSFRLFYLPWK